MIKRAKDLRNSSDEKLRGGNGVVNMIHFFEKAENPAVGRLFAKATLPSGSSIGKHKHEGEFEIYYILKGTAHVMDNDKPGVLEPGDCMVCLDGDTHSIENRGTEPVEALFLVLNTR